MEEIEQIQIGEIRKAVKYLNNRALGNDGAITELIKLRDFQKIKMKQV